MTIPVLRAGACGPGACLPLCPTTKLSSSATAGRTAASAPTTILLAGGGAGSPEKKVAPSCLDIGFGFSRSSTNTNGTYSPPMSSYGPSPIGSYIGRSPSGFSPITNNQALSDIPSIPMDQGFLSPFGSFQPGTDVADILAEDFKSNKIFSYGEQPNKQPETP